MDASRVCCAVGIAVLAATSTLPGRAQDAQNRVRPHQRPPLRIEVVPPGRSYYRQCTDWHVIEHRASGDTIVPQMRCWWALR
jgi:hypothetical protein